METRNFVTRSMCFMIYERQDLGEREHKSQFNNFALLRFQLTEEEAAEGQRERYSSWLGV